MNFSLGKVGLDKYTIRARLYPALLVALPLAVAAFVWAPGDVSAWATLWGLLTLSGGSFLLSQLAREPGRRKEPDLFQRWGGKPTTRRLRHRDAKNQTLLERRHRKLKELLGQELPSPEEESADPEAADDIYDACVTLLRERTRDRERFRLVFEENCSYGFRRNLWGLKHWGIATSGIGVAAVTVHLLLGVYLPDRAVTDVTIVAAVVNGLLLVAWLLAITPEWVRGKAEAYAEQLLSASDSIR